MRQTRKNKIDHLVDGVRQHARTQGHHPGWAFVRDALTDEHLEEMVSECRDIPQAISHVCGRVQNVLIRRE
jgi:hypothetical protein